MNGKKQKIIDSLLTPIECTGKSRGAPIIQLRGSVIETTQTYVGCLDADMSDFALGFYEIIYKEILGNHHIINSAGILQNSCFAGDTMNSFQSIANITPNAGRSKRTRSPITDWPIELQKYQRQYHCLANFWILPVNIGRKSMKLNKFDSMDIFLNQVKSNYESVFKQHHNYYSQISNPKDFYRIHFISSYSPEIVMKYSEVNAINVINQATTRIYRRAIDLAESDYADDLYNYFERVLK